MARSTEIALRVRLDGSTEAVVGRSGVHFLRGRETFYLDGRAARRLAEVYGEVIASGFDEAVSALLPSPNGKTARTSS